MRLPRVRFTVRRMMVGVAVVAAALTYLGRGSTRLGCGSVNVLLTFRVVDDRDGSPVPGASIGLFRDWSGPPTASATTGADGTARAGWQTGATWYSGPFFRAYRCLSYAEGLRIGAPGYRPVEALLRDYTSYPAHHDTPSPPPILVRLTRAPGAEAWHG
jgi:hypothetical protein